MTWGHGGGLSSPTKLVFARFGGHSVKPVEDGRGSVQCHCAHVFCGVGRDRCINLRRRQPLGRGFRVFFHHLKRRNRHARTEPTRVSQSRSRWPLRLLLRSTVRSPYSAPVRCSISNSMSRSATWVRSSRTTSSCDPFSTSSASANTVLGHRGVLSRKVVCAKTTFTKSHDGRPLS